MKKFLVKVKNRYKPENIKARFKKRIRQPLWWSTIIFAFLAFFFFFCLCVISDDNVNMRNGLERFGYRLNRETGTVEEIPISDSSTEENSSSSSSSEEFSSSSTSSTEDSTSSSEESSSSTESSSSSSTKPETFDENKYTIPDYNEWNHDKIKKFSLVQITGKVLQVMNDNGGYNLRIATDGSYGKVVLVVIESSDVKDVIAEGDNVTIYGIANGLHTYESTMRSKITVPFMLGTNYKINSYDN